MTNRFKHVQQLVSVRRLIQQDPTNADGVLRDAIFDALPTQYSQVFLFVKSHKGNVPSSMVSTAFNIAQNHASSILNELWQFGMLTRQDVTGGNGMKYLYS